MTGNPDLEARTRTTLGLMLTRMGRYEEAADPTCALGPAAPPRRDDELVGVRTRKIQKELEHIQNVSEIDSKIDKEVVLMTAEGGKEED